MQPIPTYAELMVRTDNPPGSSWGVFGPDDQLGTLNFLTPSLVAEASRLVRDGRVFTLDYPLDAFDPPPVPFRHTPEHHIFGTNPHHRDDWLDSFYLQAGSQIDGLRHLRHPDHGFYGGVPDDRIDVGTPDLGVQLMAERGIVGRGVLLDMEPLDHDRISVADIEAVADGSGVAVRSGDIVLLHTGWAERYLALSVEQRTIDEHRAEQYGPTVHPGLDQAEEMVAWLWDHQVAMLAADNLAVEALPARQDSGLTGAGPEAGSGGSPHDGMMHRPWIALLGLVLGELWRLGDLARACRADGRYEFLVVAKPLNLVGGVGSPANALAVR